VPFVTPSDMDGRRVIDRTLRHLSASGLAAVSASTVPSGSVMVSCIGSDMGKVAIAGGVSVTNQQINSIVVSEDVADPLFVYYSLLTRRAEFKQLAAGGSAQPILNKKTFSALPIALPPLPEQRAVAAALGALDDKIDLNRRIRETLERIAEAVFRSRFVEFDDAGELVESEIGWIPRGWRLVPLTELAEFVNGGAFTKHASGQGRMILRIAELNSGPGSSTRYGELDVSERQTAYSGDVLFSWSGTLGLYRWFRDEAIINQHIFKVIPRTAWPAWFVWYSVDQHMDSFRATAASKATTMGHIKREHLVQALVPVPPEREEVEVADHLLDPIWNGWLVLMQESLVLAQLRDALLRRLISGEVRLPVDLDDGEAA
jgi:type I restriction enzyme, S subunit